MSIHRRTRHKLEELLAALIYSDRFGSGPINEADVRAICFDVERMSDNELIATATQDISRITHGSWPHLGNTFDFAKEWYQTLHNAKVERDIYWLSSPHKRQ